MGIATFEINAYQSAEPVKWHHAFKKFELKALNGAKYFICYSDNCVSQNTNRYNPTMLWYCLKYATWKVLNLFFKSPTLLQK